MKERSREPNNMEKLGPEMVYKITSLFLHIKGKLLETDPSLPAEFKNCHLHFTLKINLPRRL